MIKFVYVVSLTIMSFLLFIFSKDKVEVVCKEKAKGKVEVIMDSLGNNYLGIITEENNIFFPSSMADEVVLATGQQVVICYAVDSLSFKTERKGIPVHIGAISYIKE